MPEKKYKIAIINPFRPDGLARTIFDGILLLNKIGYNFDFRISSRFDYPLLLNDHFVSKDQFINFAKDADLVFLIWGKDNTDIKLAEIIDCWRKTVFIDGSEVGKNRRYDFIIQKKIIDGQYQDNGAINREMLKKCPLYFRREKPYSTGIEPLPFGIETRYLQSYDKKIKKDIDFFCVFGQEEYPLMRRYARELLEAYCAKNGFICHTQKTKTPKEFYQLLARSKVGISVGGGGYDSFRFWEILGNNCLLLTEKIDIFESNSRMLNYKRIFQFNNLFDFQSQLEKIGNYLKTEYKASNLEKEYEIILKQHGTHSRVKKIFEVAKSRGIV
ncbi:MAG: hypothetical protein US72_C0002G0041 [Microgenomates group bacterium GW2011_GWC1_38_12]|uniref:DUF3880 domain-containing protein n=1 Tax=Candidatus Vogelbacteria bacterium RIFOXYB1_FULL_42_16 TaxID=1802436 RepID=A0A1G2QEX2_9BACT|nr:MAG: hypothetical protein US72_C0002G0041 [Microgenomates group bacterium GW2011_GWC1_38_12]KKS78147.1 MAG: hypothetical protein UV50_C0001G0057 [Parcubacteria group bacterium GW2011_GWB1_42_9]OHA59126.1 MAG: hypothetical protein A2370_02995 [Candidatus Vogelbacteria bacterium RIFOXYB1_FULL_42_16]